MAIEYRDMGDIRLPVCHWCGGVIFLGEEFQGNKDYLAHDECHEIQT